MAREVLKAVSVALVLGLGAASALAQTPAVVPMHGAMHPMPGVAGPGAWMSPAAPYPAGAAAYGAGLALDGLDLDEAQAERIETIQEDIRRAHWETIGNLRTEMFKLRRLYSADAVDPATFAEQQRKVDELRRRLTRAYIEARPSIEALLNAEQRRQFRLVGPWWWLADVEAR